MPKMTTQDVTEIVGGLAADGITVWVDGGWCIDALVGRELRNHGDLDIAVNHAAENALRGWFRARGYGHRPRADESAWNFMLGDAHGRDVDVHVFEFDDQGKNVYGIEYPAESLTGRGRSQRARCALHRARVDVQVQDRLRPSPERPSRRSSPGR